MLGCARTGAAAVSFAGSRLSLPPPTALTCITRPVDQTAARHKECTGAAVRMELIKLYGRLAQLATTDAPAAV